MYRRPAPPYAAGQSPGSVSLNPCGLRTAQGFCRLGASRPLRYAVRILRRGTVSGAGAPTGIPGRAAPGAAYHLAGRRITLAIDGLGVPAAFRLLIFFLWRIADRSRQIAESLKHICEYLEGWPEDYEIASMVRNANQAPAAAYPEPGGPQPGSSHDPAGALFHFR